MGKKVVNDIQKVLYTIFRFIVLCPKCNKKVSFNEYEFNDSCHAEIKCPKCQHEFTATIAKDTWRRRYNQRLIKAIQYLRPKVRIEYHTIETFFDKLFSMLANRGMTDSNMNDLQWQIIKTLEPPGCMMTHCKDYGHSSYFCNCALEKVPGRCGINRAYLRRIRNREAKMKEYLGKRCRTPDGKIVIPVRIWTNHFECEEEENRKIIDTLPMGKLTIEENK